MADRPMLPHPDIRFSLDGRAAASGDGSCHTRPMSQGFIGSVDDCLARFSGDVTLYQFEALTSGQDAFVQQDVHKGILPR